MYKITGEDLEGVKAELNLYLSRINERLNAVQGVKGDIDVGSSRVVANNDLVVKHQLGGLVLKDDNDPPSYWKYMAKNNGSLIAYELGGSYKDPLEGAGRSNVIPGGYDGDDVTIIGGTIAGWVISATTLSKNNATLASAGTLTLGSGTDICSIDATDSQYRIAVGNATYANAPFSVEKDGRVNTQRINVGNVHICGVGSFIQSRDYIGGAAGSGFHLSPDLLEVGNIACRGIFRSGVFQKDVVSAIGGNVVVTKNADVLKTTMTALDASTLEIEGNVTFSVGDFLRIKDDTDDEWLEVTNVAAAPVYTVTRDKGSAYGANANPAWQKGASVVNYGASGDGGVLLTASESNAPYMSVFTHAGAPWTTQTTRLRVGNLNGYLGYATDLYGIAIGETTKYLKYDPTNGLSLKSVEIEISNGNINLLAGGDITLTASDTDPALIKFGTYHNFGTSTTSSRGLCFWPDENTRYWRIGYDPTSGTFAPYDYVYISVVTGIVLDLTYSDNNSAFIEAFSDGSYSRVRFGVENTPSNPLREIHFTNAATVWFGPNSNKTIDLARAGNAWDDAYADDWNNVADFFSLDSFDDLAAIKAIKGSGIIDERTGFELIDDSTIPEQLLVKDKEGNDIVYSEDGKPYLAFKTCISLCWGAIRQLDAKIEALKASA